MKITRFPFSTRETLTATVFGDSLWLNDEEIDFSVIPEGYRLAASAIANPWLSVSDPIERGTGHQFDAQVSSEVGQPRGDMCARRADGAEPHPQ